MPVGHLGEDIRRWGMVSFWKSLQMYPKNRRFPKGAKDLPAWSPGREQVSNGEIGDEARRGVRVRWAESPEP